MAERVLDWEGCVNVRDLGGLPTENGGETRYGSVVRSDNTRRLTDAGWQALADHGVRLAVDLRWPEELAEDPPGDVPIDLLHVSLFGELDREYYDDLSERLSGFTERVDLTRESYLEFLERYKENVARVVTAVARADGAVVVHCAAGKDRTGLIAALLLRLAGVSIALVADDYAASEDNLAALTVAWREEAPDDEERARRQELYGTPRAAMVGVLTELERRYGSVRDYLLAAGVSPEDVDRAAARLR